MGDAGAKADGDDAKLVHLRIVVSGSELSLIPFEMAIAPQAYPGEGLEWALQYHLPIVPIREIRRTRPSPVRWDRELESKVLFISASPQGLEVPLSSHVQALRTALDPWIQWPKPQQQNSDAKSAPANLEQQRLPFIKERLRLLPNASIEDIYSLCAKEQFTHVHILAHGAPMEIGGERRYGLALCDHNDHNHVNVVSGKGLAKALLAEGEDGIRRSQPIMVTLSTCDSGNPGSVIVPGGSIAYDLHAAGIPWVIASQFPLTKVGSVRFTEAFYQRILRGDDPRQVLYEVRQQLYMSAESNHDWASMVVFGAIPPDFDDQITAFFERQMRHAINIALNQADNEENDREIKKALEKSIYWLDLWKARLPKGRESKDLAQRAECYGVCGSTWKRIGLLHFKKREEKKGRNDLERAYIWYNKAMAQWAIKKGNYHWVATQALSIGAVLNKPKDPETWLIAREFAERDLEKSKGSEKAWAHGTLAELAMLAKYHNPPKAGRNVKKTVQEHCSTILEMMGEQSFEVYSTRQQFQRYIDYWRKPEWDAIAQAAVSALSPSEKKEQSELPPYA
ncbi:hypothetical protein C6A37_04050 [Desulfobacteraceae bacterium SEEP-SAG9]|nr:hypothetical protein C6A37_04050 [Desulfobacteraceae bacterium SEEP-SAG9]